ncbi:MAG: hypothetical protein ACREBE_08330, partial [bacterium]
LLPLAHSATSHTGDCGVCSAMVHGGAGVADSAPTPDLAPAFATCSELVSLEPARTLPWLGCDVRSARAPPADAVTA